MCSSTWKHSQVSHFKHLQQGEETQTYPEELMDMGASKTRTGESRQQGGTVSLFSYGLRLVCSDHAVFWDYMNNVHISAPADLLTATPSPK